MHVQTTDAYAAAERLAAYLAAHDRPCDPPRDLVEYRQRTIGAIRAVIQLMADLRDARAAEALTRPARTLCAYHHLPAPKLSLVLLIDFGGDGVVVRVLRCRRRGRVQRWVERQYAATN